MPKRSRGFALVVTLSLMILLTVIAVGLLSLSSISLRASSQSSDLATARSNARMALMLAIGELQLQAGPDTRITARADILDDQNNAKNPPILGVWKSWEGTDHETTGSFAGRPISPGDYKSQKESRFLSWLVSGDPAKLKDSAKPPSTAKSATSVSLVGSNTVDPTNAILQIHLPPVLVTANGKKGSYAWWVGGENQKARLPKPNTAPANDAQWAATLKSDSTADPKPFDLEKVLADPSLAARAINLKQADLINASSGSSLKTSVKYFHDLSTVSTGLLTNTATGGWRKDLSLFTEKYSSLASSGLPLFRLTPNSDTSCAIPKGVASNFRAAKSILYPWSDYRGTAGDPPIYQQGAVASWENLKDYALFYQSALPFNLATRSSPMTSDTSASGCYNFLHKVRLLPVIARVQWIFSHSAGPADTPPTGSEANPPGSLTPRLLVTPLITLWNPYNVKLTSAAGYKFTIQRPLPCALKYTVNGVTYTKFRSLTSGSYNYTSKALSDASALNYTITGAVSLNPGQTRVYGPPAAAVPATNAELLMTPGFRRTGGHYFKVLDDNDKPVVVPGSSSIKADAKFDNAYNDEAQGVGIYLDMLSIADSNNRHLAYRMVYAPAVATKTYPELTGLSEALPLNSVQTTPIPFLSTMFGARLASNTHIPAKGFLQTSPLVNYTAMGGKDLVERTIGRHYGGTNHPVNSPFDYSFVAHAGLDSYFPSLSGDSGYIVSGFTSGNGLSRCIAAEVPTRPLASLAELQHWDLRYENPIPPYSFNIIGNSDATPLIPANAVLNAADAGLTTNLQHDDSYCANHLLFDDWFFSSIAAGNPTGFGKASSTSLQKPYTDFLTGTTPLINRAYKPLPEDVALAKNSTADANGLFTKYADQSNSWKNIASRLEVEGMFNVNSTSVTAWRALLGHARNGKVPYTNSTGTVSLGAEGDYAVSRSTIAGDSKAGSFGSSGSFSGATECAGYRELEPALLDAFAQKIVDQIRLRGPFLSLSEFVNRQLSSGDLALAGTIQSALNKLADNSSTNFYSGLIAAIDAPPDKKFATASTFSQALAAEYKFPKAAEGICVYGIPGWTRQADVLRPLAPILSARDDTFVIRAFGESRNANDKVVARAVCEVVVRRSRGYCDPSEAADLATPPVQPVNKVFGRRFETVSFRWLSPSEI